jgi:uncharacterized membrane protein required for colicin V production
MKLMNLSVIDILFVITVVLMVFNGLRNGFVFSLVNFLSVPVGLAVTYFYGPQFTSFLAGNGLPATPLIAYIVLFLGVVLLIHILGNSVRRFVRHVPLVSQGDTLLGGAVGIVEAWLLWLFLLVLLGAFLGNLQTSLLQGTTLVTGLNIHADQLQSWHDFYNQAVNHSLFARVNGFFVKELPAIPTLSTTH